MEDGKKTKTFTESGIQEMYMENQEKTSSTPYIKENMSGRNRMTEGKTPKCLHDLEWLMMCNVKINKRKKTSSESYTHRGRQRSEGVRICVCLQ